MLGFFILVFLLWNMVLAHESLESIGPVSWQYILSV